MSDCHVRLRLCDFLELKEYQLIDMAPSFTRPLATTARCMSITRSNIDMTSACMRFHCLSMSASTNIKRSRINAAQTTQRSSLISSLDSPELGYGTFNACFSPIDPAAEKPGQWVGQYHRQGKHRSEIPAGPKATYHQQITTSEVNLLVF